MSDYKELILDLRDADQANWKRLSLDAAAAIEELQAQLPKRGEIVRCGECKYHLPETERTNPYCNRFHCMKPDDWFCADGEREVQE